MQQPSPSQSAFVLSLSGKQFFRNMQAFMQSVPTDAQSYLDVYLQHLQQNTMDVVKFRTALLYEIQKIQKTG